MKSEYILNNLKRSDRNQGITLVICFSRPVFVPVFFNALRDMDLPRENMHLLVYDNTQDRVLADALRNECVSMQEQFLSVRIYKSNISGRGSVDQMGNECFVNSKLYNIWNMWKHLLNLIYTETFFQLEDDTIAPPDAFRKLYKILLRNKKIGMVTGIETGRAHIPWQPVRLGVHKIKQKGELMLYRHSFHPSTKGIKEIDAAGVYCFVARTQAWKLGFIKYKGYIVDIPFFAMDNAVTYKIKQHGFKLYADFSVWCAHLYASSARIIAFGKDQAIEMIDLFLPKYNSYAMNIEPHKKGYKKKPRKVVGAAPTWNLEKEEDENPEPSLPVETPSGS